MKVLVIGAAGFIGTRLRASLLGRGALRQQGGPARPITELILVDSKPLPPAAQGGIPISMLQGDICDARFLDHVFATGVDVVFHLAATLTLDAEMDFVHGLEVNVHALMRLLECCRHSGKAPVFVFASSISTFGGPLPVTVDDHVAQTPQTSYGTHKAIAELLINDYSRRGFVDGRTLRLPIVLTHPGPPTASVSDRISALIREPLNGRDAVCPLDAGTRFPVASAGTAAAGLIRASEIPSSAFGATRAMNLPSLTVTPADIAAAVDKAGAGTPSGRIIWQRDEAMQRIVNGWPRAFTSGTALRLGIAGDASIAAIINDYKETALGRT
ncbi:MAG TPA: NAD-dependent epimerase/dehydratase family protein [Noviherbaspirillum sp.]|uniref:NAD-dependent epimerase/dehydratase family protein n=1 Tax=Noviherbaspirillum sp. TaxID=1926288 RepID=UPI002DDD034C|nr:NAD-dependent epimerase/dehydratase family protein [Noviherbaspirillum sp.]HEV2611991.1 NAD-dependent epimerase/dehydratase family protein [Noviherbaspirillum sp.]